MLLLVKSPTDNELFSRHAFLVRQYMKSSIYCMMTSNAR